MPPMLITSNTYRSHIDECLNKAGGWLDADHVEPALCELDEAVRIVEERVRDGAAEHPTLHLMKLANMVHRCKASPRCRSGSADAAHRLAMRIRGASSYGSPDIGTYAADPRH